MSESLEQMLFCGRSYLKTDDAGRLFIPTNIKKVLGSRNSEKPDSLWIVATERDDHPYLACYDERGFQELQDKPKGPNIEHAQIKQSRVLITPWQRVYAKLGDDVVLAASPDMTHLEIWNQEFFEKNYRVVDQSTVNNSES